MVLLHVSILHYNAVTATGHGFKLAPVFGKILAELALDRPSSYSLEPFKISRCT